MTVERSMSGLRKMEAPFVVAPPSGARTRTRLRVTEAEADALRRIGTFLGTEYRKALRNVVAANPATFKEARTWRHEHRMKLSEVTNASWGDTIVRTAVDSRALGLRNLKAERAMLKGSIDTISRRLAVPLGETVTAKSRGDRAIKSYSNVGERHQKARRLAGHKRRLARVDERIASNTPRIVCGGRSLWEKRANLADAGLTAEQWRQQWNDSRLFLTADGATGRVDGNRTIRVSEEGVARIRVPYALEPQLGKWLELASPVGFGTHRGDEWLDRIAARASIRYDISVRDGRWYIDASWGYKDVPVPPLEALRTKRTLGVDLNAGKFGDDFGHVDVAVIDPSGNFVGSPKRIEISKIGPASTREGSLRHAITRLIHVAKKAGCASISIEDLDFSAARALGRESGGRGRRGKELRRTVAGLPTAKFRNRLVGMAGTAGLFVVAVDPAYTSKWGLKYWSGPLKASGRPDDRHSAASVVIGRRSLGYGARRKPVGPRMSPRRHAGFRSDQLSESSEMRSSTSRASASPKPKNTVQAEMELRTRGEGPSGVGGQPGNGP